MQPGIEALEEKLGYRFRNRELLVRALTHRSSSASWNSDNQQLEFLGDAVLGFVVSDLLVSRNPSLREGELTVWKAHLVNATHLSHCAKTLGIGDYLLIGSAEEKNGGRERRSFLADALEAVIAAVHIDGGIEAARAFIDRHVVARLENPKEAARSGLISPKTVLQEKAHALGLPAPEYDVVETSGPEHAKTFTIEARIGEQLIARATESSKKGAGQRAAQLLLEQLESAEPILDGRPAAD